MPALKQRSVVEILRGVKAYLNLEMGLTRSEVPGSGPRSQEFEEIRKRLARRTEELAKLQRKSARTDARAGRIDPANIVWIFGFGRSGTTWLTHMMREPANRISWLEPTIGSLFGNLYYNDARKDQLESRSFILGSRREFWTGPMRSFILDSIDARFPKADENTILVVKETDGSLGAPLLMEALPESRLIFLIRDPRDVIASRLDAFGVKGWAEERLGDDTPTFSAEQWAAIYMKQVGNAREAYEMHTGRKVLVRYEDLLSDTLATMRRIYASLEMGVEEKELVQTVKKHSWDNIPGDEKGRGRFYRKATPGGWREDLTSEQAQQIEKITAPILNAFYAS